MKPLAARTSFFVILLMMIISCNGLFSQSKLPDTWPADMVLKITYGGGMRYYSSETVISLSESYTLINEQGVEKKTPLNFTPQQLNQLLKIMKANKFDQLHSSPRPGIVYDMGTTSTLLSWDGRAAGVSIGATTELPEKFKEQYYRVNAAIDNLLGHR